MATLVIRKVEDHIKLRLRERAISHGRSMEEEARTILRSALVDDEENWGQRLVQTARELFGPENGVELDLPPREIGRDPPSFDP